MRSGALLINTACGPLVDRAALLDALRHRHIQAGLDVFDEEPLPADDPLRGLPNVVMTPHLGYAAEPVFRQFHGESVENIRAYLDGRPICTLTP